MYNNQFIDSNGYYNNYILQQPTISIQDSIQIALSHISGQVMKVELETENGFLFYEVKIVTPQGVPYEIKVDANKGNVVNIEIDF